ncbi:MAG: hypothetical protein AAF602_28970 [Myxococcota bacterium]
MEAWRLVIAIGGGVVAAAWLAVPLYLAWPGWWLPDWGAVPVALQLGAVVAALASLGAVGRRAARGAAEGAFLGTVAGAVVYLLIGSAAAGVASVGEFLAAAPFGEQEAERMAEQLVRATLRAGPAQGLAYLGCLALGAALGALGAATHAAAPRTRLVTALAPDVWFSSEIVLGLMNVVVLLGLSRLRDGVADWAVGAGASVWVGAVDVTALAAATLLAAVVVGLGRRLAGGWRHAHPESRAAARYYAVLGGLVPLGAFGVAFASEPLLVARPVVMVGVGLVLLALVDGVRSVLRDPSPEPLLTPGFAQIGTQAILSAVRWLSSIGVAGLGMGVALAFGAVPYVSLEPGPPVLDTVRAIHDWLSLRSGLALVVLILGNAMQLALLEWLRSQARRRAVSED